jgi:hypothetical protein
MIVANAVDGRPDDAVDVDKCCRGDLSPDDDKPMCDECLTGNTAVSVLRKQFVENGV